MFAYQFMNFFFFFKKEQFKHLSRKFTHKVMKKEEGKFTMTPKTSEKIRKFIDAYFSRKTK